MGRAAVTTTGIRTDMHRLPPGRDERMGPRRSFARQRAAKLAARNTATDPTGPPLADGSALPAASLLQLIWLASPALPVGGFSYSEGLEAASNGAASLPKRIASDWLLRPVAPEPGARRPGRGGQSRGRLAARRPGRMCASSTTGCCRPAKPANCARRPSRWAARCWTGCATSTHGQPAPAADRRAGRAAARPTRWPLRWPPRAPARRVRDCLLAFAFGWAENMVQAALKSVPLGQSAGQRILARLAAEIPAAVDHALAPDGRASARPSRPCWPSCRRSMKPSIRGCSAPERPSNQ